MTHDDLLIDLDGLGGLGVWDIVDLLVREGVPDLGEPRARDWIARALDPDDRNERACAWLGRGSFWCARLLGWAMRHDGYDIETYEWADLWGSREPERGEGARMAMILGAPARGHFHNLPEFLGMCDRTDVLLADRSAPGVWPCDLVWLNLSPRRTAAVATIVEYLERCERDVRE